MTSLQELLWKLADIQKASGANAASSELRLLAAAAQGELTERIAALDLVDYFVSELKASRGDKPRFNELFALLKKSGVVSTDQAKEIAQGYLDTTAKFGSKKVALEAIRDARAGEDRLGGKLAAS